MPQSSPKWYKSPAFVGLVLTLAGFGAVTLLYKVVSERLLGL